MSSRRTAGRKGLRAAAVAVYLLAATACGVRQEQVILSDFFAASRLRDLTALSRFATVVFEPRDQGTVGDFEIRRVSDDEPSGDHLTKQVTIVAPVNVPDGRIVEKSLRITLQRPKKVAGRVPYDGWIVTGWTVTAVSDPAKTPPRPPS